MRHLLPVPLLLLSACGPNPPATPPGLAHYVCRDGTTATVSFSDDRHLLRLGLPGGTSTLTRNAAGDTWSNGRITAAADERFLHLDIAGTLLTRHCVRQDSRP